MVSGSAASLEDLHDRQRAAHLDNAVTVGLCPEDRGLRAKLHGSVALLVFEVSQGSDLGGVSEDAAGTCAGLEDGRAALAANLATATSSDGDHVNGE